MGPMTGLVTTDSKLSAREVAEAGSHAEATSWISRRLQRIAEYRRRRRLQAELSAMSDHMLLDVGVSEDEIYMIRQGNSVTPRAWLARNPSTRHLIG